MAAASSIDITPPVGIYLHNWSYSTRERSEGIHRPLFASLLVLGPRAHDEPSLIVSLDLGWWMEEDDESALRSALLDACSIPPERLILALTHTHSGPSIARADRDRPGGELIDPYLTGITESICAEARRLFSATRPATLEWSYGRCDLAVSRDLYVPDAGRFVVGANPAGDADDTLLVGRLTAEGGSIAAVLVNYAAHPTSLGGDNALVSPDYLGSARELIQDATGGVFLFLQGASGDLSPRIQYSGDPSIADRNGRVLGHAVLATLERMLPPATVYDYDVTIESGAPLGIFAARTADPCDGATYRQHELELPTQENRPPAAVDPRVQADRETRASRVRSNAADPVTTFTVTVWEIGPAVVFAYPGEAYSELQMQLREAAPDRPVVVVNLANGPHKGYVAPEAAYSDARYPAWQSPLAPGCFEKLLGTCMHHLAMMINRDRSTA